MFFPKGKMTKRNKKRLYRIAELLVGGIIFFVMGTDMETIILVLILLYLVLESWDNTIERIDNDLRILDKKITQLKDQK